METKPKQKAKQIIKELDFSGEGCAVSLVGPSVAGAANNFKTLIFKSALTQESNPVVEPTVEDTSKSNEVDKGVSGPAIKQTKETNMDEKEKLEALQKSFEDNKVMLQKALDEVNTLKAEKQEQVIKSKTAKITEIVKDKEHAKIIAKACLELESEEDFTAFVAAISAMQTTIDKTDMFIEKGLNVDNAEAKNETNHVEKLLKAKNAAK